MRIKGKMILLVAIVALLMVPALGQAEMYVEGYVGGNLGDNASMSCTTNHPLPAAAGSAYEHHNIPGRIDPSVIGGLKLGTWFVKEGFLGFNYPDWMKYLGFYLDLSYNNLDNRRSRIHSRGVDNIPPVFGSAAIPGRCGLFSSEARLFTVAFMFAARYGFFADSEVPFGRLQPYVAVGPAIACSSMKPQICSERYLAEGPAFINPYTIQPGSKSEVNIALAVESGVRWMALKNVSIDVSFKYRYFEPSYTFNYIDPMYGQPVSFSLSPTYNLFSFQVGAAYHF